jgi:hypothetical protein
MHLFDTFHIFPYPLLLHGLVHEPNLYVRKGMLCLVCAGVYLLLRIGISLVDAVFLIEVLLRILILSF